MRKIDLRPYATEQLDVEGKTLPFDVRSSLVNALFLKPLNGVALLKRDDLARKIEANDGADLLLEEQEWYEVKIAVQEAELQGRWYVEFVRRVLEATEVKVIEQPEGT